MKKRTFSLFLGLIFTFTLILSISSYAFARSSSDDTMKIKVPSGWKKDSSVSEVYVPTKGGGSVIISKSGVPDSTNTPDKYMTKAKKEISAIYSKITFKPVKKLKIAGKEARSIEYSTKIGTIEMQFYVLYVFDGDYVNIMTCSALKSKYKAYTSDFQKFIKSIKL
jgi:predicted Zn-dependent protease